MTRLTGKMKEKFTSRKNTIGMTGIQRETFTKRTARGQNYKMYDIPAKMTGLFW
jgi:hypothetical protein